MSGKWLFKVLSKSSASKIDLFSSTFPSSPSNLNRFYTSPLGNYSNLSDVASNAYSTVKATVENKVHSGISSAIRNEVHSLTTTGLEYMRAFVSYVGNPFEFQKLPKSIMSQFGFTPNSNEECPILQTPSVEVIGGLAAKFVPGGAGMIYTGVVDMNKYGDGSRHFYMVAAKCGNINTIARAASLPVDRVAARLGSMLGMLATWAGCMMAGGAIIEPASGALQELDDMDSGGSAPKQPVFGKGILTVGMDMVQLQNATRAASGSAKLHSFLARTLYCHVLVGTVLHVQYIAANGDIIWFWVGGGGKGFISKRINNVAAIQLDIGIWPDMARSITAFYADPNVVRKFVGAKPQAIKKLIPELIVSTAEKKSLFLQLEQAVQVQNPGSGAHLVMSCCIPAGCLEWAILSPFGGRAGAGARSRLCRTSGA